ncbi:MAG TPA: FdhC protein [Aminobacterium sp.]|uniref:formate/nitrite transporter family protein n=2 Tax=Aminobacteriaceae TaxID=3029087 RepID=UPI000EB813C1|nr:formate/nitrite transporter family protein [Aminobacterium sp. UBA4834]HCA40438.1 FdhC protein [Aminobacterium sp.]
MDYKTPFELAKAACTASQTKVSWSISQMLLLGILAGAYIAFGGWLMVSVTYDVPGGLGKFLAGVVFSVGLILVVIAGGELFTGNCMMPLGALVGCTPMKNIMRAWFWVYIANLIGATLVAYLLYFTALWNGPIGAKTLSIAAGKMGLPFGQAFVRGILCNWLVVLAVWLSMAATDITGKIWAIFFPIMAFVASGFEHSVANMYFMAMGLLLKKSPEMIQMAGLSDAQLQFVSIGGYIHNLVPVTLGNIVGGALFVATFYYWIFKKKLKEADL